MKYSSATGFVRIDGVESLFNVSEDGSIYLSVKLDNFDKAIEWLKSLEGEVAQPVEKVEKPKKVKPPEPVVEAPAPAPAPEPPKETVEILFNVVEKAVPEPVKLPEPVEVVAAVVEPQLDLFKPAPEPEPVEPEPEKFEAPSETSDAPQPKRRGRPPGSKNKVREAQASEDAPLRIPAPAKPIESLPITKLVTPAKIEEVRKATEVGLVIRRVLKMENTSFPIEVRPAGLGWSASCPQLPDLQGVGTNETDAVNDLRMAIADWHSAMQKQAAKSAAAAAAGLPVEPEPVKLTPREKMVTIHPTPEAAQAIPPVYDSLEDLGDECVKCQSPGEAVRLAIFFHFDNNAEHLSKPYEALLKYTATYMTSIWPRVPALQGKKIRSPEKQLDLARTYLDQYLRVKNGKSPVGNDED